MLQDEAAAVWRSLHPAGAAAIIAARRTQIESRHHPQAILEGSGTFVTETDAPPPALPPAGPGVAALLEPSLPEVTGGRWFVVVDGRGRVRWTYKGDAGTRLLVLVCRTTPVDYLAYLRREQIPYLVAGSGPVDLALALQMMKASLGVTCVLAEAGGGLNGALLRAGLVDELHLVLLPTLIGGWDAPTAFDGQPLHLSDIPTPLRLLNVQTSTDGVVWLHYDVAASVPVEPPATQQ